nr:DNA polymerase III subunit delta [Sphingomonas insulae]
MALERPSPDIRLYLLHGPDGSATAELAGVLAKAMGTDSERVDIDGASLRSDPARLSDEAASMSLFGSARHIRVSPAGEECLEAFTTLLNADHAGNPVVALAPSVKSTAKIVKLAIESRQAMAFAAYEPSAADLERLATAMARDHGLRPNGGTAARLATSCGGDRAVLAREIEKLALFLDAAPDRPHDLDDAALDAIGADLGEAEMTQVVDAVITGHTAILGAELSRLNDAGTSPIPWLRLLARKLMTLADMKADIEAGASQDSVFKRHRIFFREEAATAQALRRWNPLMLSAALSRVRHAERAVMSSSNAGSVLAEHALMELTRGVQKRG